jgi:hypothetical protein
MRKEHDVVRLKREVSGVPMGSLVCVMMTSPLNPESYLVEYTGLDGLDSQLISVIEDDVESYTGDSTGIQQWRIR